MYFSVCIFSGYIIHNILSQYVFTKYFYIRNYRPKRIHHIPSNRHFSLSIATYTRIRYYFGHFKQQNFPAMCTHDYYVY